MPNQIIQMLIKQLQTRNPQGFQTVQNLMQNKSNPQALLQQMMSNATPEQKQSLLNQAKQYGVPQDILSKVQNMK